MTYTVKNFCLPEQENGAIHLHEKSDNSEPRKSHNDHEQTSEEDKWPSNLGPPNEKLHCAPYSNQHYESANEGHLHSVRYGIIQNHLILTYICHDQEGTIQEEYQG